MHALILATAAAFTLVACNNAAETDSTEMSNIDGADQSSADSGMTMASYAPAAAIGDMYEIESSRLALEKGRSTEVKQFAEQMIADHTRTSDALKQFVQQNGNGMTLPTSLDARHQGMIEQLRNASGSDFDRMYMMQQMAAHDEAMALHRGYAEGGDDEQARALARTTVGVIERHVERMQSAMPAGSASNGSGATRDMPNTGMTSPGTATGGMTVTPSRGVSPDTSRSSTNPTRTNADGTTPPPSQ